MSERVETVRDYCCYDFIVYFLCLIDGMINFANRVIFVITQASILSRHRPLDSYLYNVSHNDRLVVHMNESN